MGEETKKKCCEDCNCDPNCCQNPINDKDSGCCSDGKCCCCCNCGDSKCC